MNFFDRLKIPPRRERPGIIAAVNAVKAEHRLCPRLPEGPSSLGYDSPIQLPRFTVRCTCGGEWTWTITARDLADMFLANARTEGKANDAA